MALRQSNELYKYIIMWMEWVEITNNQKEFFMYFELVYCWFSKRIPNLDYCWFSGLKDAVGKSGEGIICCSIIWTRDLLMLMALIFESLLFVLWSTVACTWVVVVIWTMIKDYCKILYFLLLFLLRLLALASFVLFISMLMQY